MKLNKDKILKILFLCSSLCIGVSTYAASDQIPKTRKITDIQVYDNMVFVSYSPAFKTTQGCKITNNDNVLVIDTSNGKGKEIYSLALSAALSEKNVGFGVSGCYQERPKMYRLDMRVL
jgi:hypothetical protein